MSPGVDDVNFQEQPTSGAGESHQGRGGELPKALTGIRGLDEITFDLSAPYISSSYLCLGTVIVLAAYGCHTAMRGRPAFGAGFLHDEPARP